MSHPFRIASFFVAAIAALPLHAEVTLPNVFSDHAVLQRNARVPVWGWAEPGESVTVTLADDAATTEADAAGRWRVDIDTGEAGGPFTLTVTGDDTARAVVIQDVLLGDVWLCSGQSNMEWVVRRSDDADAEIAAADWPRIRHLDVPNVVAALPQRDQAGTWTVCSPDTVANFTAVGYYFARELQRELDVPIGLVNATWGGTRIEPWTAGEGLAMVESLRAQYELAALQDPAGEPYQREADAYLDEAQTWLEQARAAADRHAHFPAPPALPQSLVPFTSRTDPTVLYNGMVHPVMPYRVRGAIWYQGESNHGESDYVDKSIALVEGWRKVWQRDLPFYFVQLAPYRYGSSSPQVLPAFWEQQAAVERAIDDAGMVVINDIGDADDIHPTNKQEVGRRLANLALKRTYGVAGAAESGPRFRSLTVDNDALRVTFDHAEGLRTRDGEAPDHFEIVGKGTGWRTASATIDGDSVVLRADDVPQPTAVRFAWHSLASPNLVNAAGLPTGAFRAGDVPDDEPLVLDVPEARQYQLVYDLDLAKLGRETAYDVDRAAEVTQPFDRVAYYMELRRPGEPLRWVFVSLDAFTDDPHKLGLPTLASGAFFQQPATNLHVISNTPGVPNGEAIEGAIEFWPHNYRARNAADVPGASDQVNDFGDEPDLRVPDGHGSMQLHAPRLRATLFAINRWSAGDRADLGLGNSPGQHPDWTLAANASDYEVKRLRVYVRLAEK